MAMSAFPRTTRLRGRGAAVATACALALLAAGLLALTAQRATSLDEGLRFFGLWRTRDLLGALALAWCAVAILLGAHSRRALLAFVAAQATAGLALLGLELAGFAGLLSFERSAAAELPEELGRRRAPHQDLRGETQQDLALMWGIPSAPIPYHYRTDRRGFRNEPDRESADVYLLGDSFLVAGLVPFEQILSARLERALERPVMNVALVGLSPQEESELLLTSELPLAGRLVLHFVFEGNDLRDSARSRHGPLRRPSWKERTLTNRLVLALQAATQPRAQLVALRTGWIGEEPYLFHWLSNSFRGFEGELEAIEATLGELRRRVESQGGRYALVLVPAKLRVLGPLARFPDGSPLSDWRAHLGPLPERLASWSAREGVPYLDLTPALSASARAGALPWFPLDTHWNELGHAAAARALAEADFVRAWSAAERSR